MQITKAIAITLTSSHEACSVADPGFARRTEHQPQSWRDPLFGHSPRKQHKNEENWAGVWSLVQYLLFIIDVVLMENEFYSV